MNFHSDYSCDGFWKLSIDDEQQYFCGRLKYSPENGIEVLVFGSFYGTVGLEKLKGRTKEKYIYGVSATGEFLTLIDCDLSESGYSYNLIQTRIISKYFIKGRHLSTNDTAEISAINAHLPLLAQWFDQKSSFKNKFENSGDGVTIKYKQPKARSFFENSEISIYIFSAWYPELGSKYHKTTTISQREFLNIEFKKKIDLIKGIDYLIFLKKFLSFFTFYDFRFDEVNAFTKINGASEAFRIIFKDEGRYHLPTTNFNIQIFYSEISRRLPGILKKWIEQKDEYEDIFGYFFDIKHNLVSNKKNIFLNLCFSIERFHQTFLDKKPFNNKKVNEFKSLLTKNKAVPNKFKQRLSDVLLHFNELSFSQRLQAIIEKTNDFTSEFITHKEDFIKNVKNTRNNLVHKTNTKKNIISYENLIYYNNALILVLEISMLQHFKIPHKVIKKFIGRDFTVSVIKKNLSNK